MSTNPVREVREWLTDNWDPDLSVRDWWHRLGMSGWGAPTWPLECFGKGLPVAEALQVQRAISEFGALGAPGGLGMLLAGPTIVTHGSEEQKMRFLPDIVSGRAAWCQLFSEPVAGSDLAGIQTRAARHGDDWVVDGQKVWTSSAHVADFGMLIARTNVDAPKHRGISYFVVDMRESGIEVRPLRELTGRALFNEVFLSAVHVAADDLIGGLDEGWRVANTTLAHERVGLGGGTAGEPAAHPGSIAGHLDKRAGDFVDGKVGRVRSANPFGVSADRLVELARRHGRSRDPQIRQRLAHVYTDMQIGRYMTLRNKGLRAKGQEIPGLGNIAKLRMSEMFRESRDLGMEILGARGMLHDYSGSARTSDPDDIADRAMTALALWSPAPAIYGGTDEVQHNILAERVLGLPREPGPDRSTPFRDLPKNV